MKERRKDEKYSFITALVCNKLAKYRNSPHTHTIYNIEYLVLNPNQKWFENSLFVWMWMIFFILNIFVKTNNL